MLSNTCHMLCKKILQGLYHYDILYKKFDTLCKIRQHLNCNAFFRCDGEDDACASIENFHFLRDVAQTSMHPPATFLFRWTTSIFSGNQTSIVLLHCQILQFSIPMWTRATSLLTRASPRKVSPSELS